MYSALLSGSSYGHTDNRFIISQYSLDSHVVVLNRNLIPLLAIDQPENVVEHIVALAVRQQLESLGVIHGPLLLIDLNFARQSVKVNPDNSERA